MIKAYFKKHTLNFKQASGTSRGVLINKDTWLLFLEENGTVGIGECAMFRGLSCDDQPDYEIKLAWLCENINKAKEELFKELNTYPSIVFGMEMAFESLKSEDPFNLFPSRFTEGKDSIDINGLIWMGSVDFMKQQIKDKIKSGFSCIKMKIGAIDFETELNLLKSIRNEFSENDIQLRVDANGAFQAVEALEKLKCLSELQLHSIEQPIKQGQLEEMSKLCEQTPLPIALDEELIGIHDVTKKRALLHIINPQYIILKPSLVGGFKSSEAWIQLAEEQHVGWWFTSALESNVGLNAIAQYTYTKQSNLPQGLGTGGLFTNNFDSPLEVGNGHLHYNPNKAWQMDLKDTNLNI